MWLHNFKARRPAAPPREPVTCEQLGAITVPTFVVGAEYGMPYSRRIVDMLAGCIPGSCSVVIQAEAEPFAPKKGKFAPWQFLA